MPVIRWNDTLVGLREVDQHHKQLIDFLGATYEASQIDASPPEVNCSIEEMLDYTDEHFSREERWMAEAGCPGLARHKKEHGLFALQAQELRDQRNRMAAAEIIGFLSDWIRCHILTTDAEFRIFLDQQNNGRMLRDAGQVEG